MQRFIAREPYDFPNGARGWRPGGPFDCLGPFAKVERCPIEGTHLRRTAYATGYADTAFSVPACTRYRGRYIGGFLTTDSDGGVVFRPYDRFRDRLPAHDTPAVGWDGTQIFVDSRVEIHPGTDMWMRGARYGTVTRIVPTPEDRVRVRMDALPRQTFTAPVDRFRRID